MNAAAKYNLVCYQVSQVPPIDLRPDMAGALAEITGTVAAVLAASRSVEAKARKALPQVYAFRLKALDWLQGDMAFNFLAEAGDLAAQVPQGPPELDELAQTVAFGLRWHHRVLGGLSQPPLHGAVPQPPPADYEALMSALGQVPGDLANNLARWVDASLLFEFGALAHYMLASGTVPASRASIREIALATADAAQEYAALAATLGFVNLATTKAAPRIRATPEEVAIQQALAEEGMADYAKHLEQ
jgi:hypothetical protein